MKSTSFITTLFAALVVAVSPAFAQTNPWQTLEGNVSLKGLGTMNGIAFSDVKVSAKLGAQFSGPKVTGPAGVYPATNSVAAVDGVAAKAAKITNKEILALAQLDPKGYKIRWARVGGLPVLEAYNKSGSVVQIPADILTADVTWAANYTGIYGGGADLQATPTASGTSVYVSSGKLTGLTSIYGSALGYLPFSGVGKFTADQKKQLSAKARVAGIGDSTPPTP